MRSETPIQTSYRPELDISPENKSEDGAYHQSLTGILIWMVEIIMIDIFLEVSMMLSQLDSLREGYM